MGLLTKMRKQKAVYWAPATVPVDDNGNTVYVTPVELTVRWEDVMKSFVDAQGEIRTSRSRVYVGEDVAINGVLLLGALTDALDWDDPFNNVGAYRILAFNKTPDLKAKNFLRVAMF